MKKICCVVSCLFINYLTLFAVVVGDISFTQTGTIKVPKDLLEYNTHLKSGDEFTQSKLNEDIKALYSTGYFTDVETKLSTSPEGKVDIAYTLTNTPRVMEIVIKGNEKFSTDKIMAEVRLGKNEPLVQKLLQESIANIKKLYTGNGYYQVGVLPSIVTEAPGEVVVTFNIQENQRLRVDNVYFNGNTVFSSWKLKDDIQTAHNYLSWLMDWGLFDEQVAKQDELRIRNVYWTKGYLDVKVSMHVDKVEGSPDYVNVTFDIVEGEPYKVGKINIVGNTVFSEDEIMSAIVIKDGEFYNYKLEEASAENIKTKFDRLGYSDIVCNPSIEADFNTHIVDVTFDIVEGQAYNVRNVNISGNKITKDYVIRRELPIQPGDPVNNRLIDTGKSRLMAMNYFSKVETFNSNTNVPGEKDVNYEVEEKSTAKAAIGGGFSTDDGLVGRLSLTESNFDITDPSTYFRGGGQRVNLLAQIGNERQDVVLNFTEPWLFGIPLRLDASGFFNIRDYPEWTERHLGTEWGLTKQVGSFNSIGLSYIFDFVKTYEFAQGYPNSFTNIYEGNSRKGALTLSASRDTRDDLFNPTSGYILNGKGLFDTVALGSDTNYYGFEASAHGYWNFLDKFFVLHLGTKAGTTGGLSNNDDVPIYQKYFLGGQNSLRGFKFMSVSPLADGSDLPGGGLSMWTGTAELHHPIYKWISGYPFVDIGNAWANPFDYSFDFNVGIGYGIKLAIPMISSVPLRLDLGFPVRSVESAYNNGPQFYFDVGAEY